MRQPRSCAGIGVAGLGVLVFAVGCVPPSAARDDRAPGARAEAAAREGIARQIALRVDAMRRKDVDAMLRDAEVSWPGPDGTTMTRDQMRATIAREWANVERTVDLTVRIDSLRLAQSDSATVFTSQRWERIVVAGDGSRHAVVTSASVEQAWTRSAGGWRGSGVARVLKVGPTLIDGGAPAVARRS